MKLSSLIRFPQKVTKYITDSIEVQISHQRKVGLGIGNLFLDILSWFVKRLMKLTNYLTEYAIDIINSEKAALFFDKLDTSYDTCKDFTTAKLELAYKYLSCRLKEFHRKALNTVNKDTAYTAFKVSKTEFNYIGSHPMAFASGAGFLYWQLPYLKESLADTTKSLTFLNITTWKQTAPIFFQSLFLSTSLLGCTALNLTTLISPTISVNKPLASSIIALDLVLVYFIKHGQQTSRDKHSSSPGA